MALIQCKECGGMISDRAKSCPKCGCSVIKEKPKSICPECGIEVSDNDEKCPNCGFPFSHLEENNRLLGSLSDIKEDKHEEICVCPHCGWRYKRGTAETCPICKADLREAQDYDRQQNFVYNPSVLDRIFDFVLDYWYLCVSVVVCLLIWGYYSWGNQSSESQNKSVVVRLTTPQNDGRICSELIRNAKTLKELDEVRVKVYKYIDAYQDKIYEGKISGQDYKDFLLEIGNVDAAIDSRAAYIVEFGNKEQ